LVEVYDVDVDLQHEAQKVVSIFQNEARMKRIGLNLVIGESINRLGVNTIKTDPVRLGQVYVFSPYLQKGADDQRNQPLVQRYTVHLDF